MVNSAKPKLSYGQGAQIKILPYRGYPKCQSLVTPHHTPGEVFIAALMLSGWELGGEWATGN